MKILVKTLRGDQIHPFLEAVAGLRISVFSEYPYLYDGDAAYETWYLQKFAALEGAVVVAAFQDGKLIGAATGSPLAYQFEEFSAPLKEAGYDLGKIFYCGESVLLRGYRGQGLGHQFFDHREAQARALGLKASCFLSVMRAETDPRRPSDYRDLHGFWKKRGYAPLEGVTASFSWKEHGREGEQMNQLNYWMRTL